MEQIENKPINNKRSRALELLKSKYPDKNFGEENDVNDLNSLEESLLDYLEESVESNNQYKDLEEKTNAFTSLFNQSPKAAQFLQTLAVTEDPAAAIYKVYGESARDAFIEGKGSEFIAKIEAEDAKARAEDEAYEAEKEANLKESFDKLDKWGDAKGLNEEQKVEVFMRFYNILMDALIGKYSEELFEMGWKADHYDADIENARHEGEVTGRNANIREKMARRETNETMPPALSGQGERTEEVQPRKKSNPWML